jgi:hypothetical protein
MQKLKNLLLFCSILSLFGCLSTASLAKFPKTNENILFNQYQSFDKTKLEEGWSFGTTNEFYLSLLNINKANLEEIIQDALKRNAYEVVYKDFEKNTIIGKRGLMPGEWNSYMGVYYTSGDSSKIYIRCDFTQDITGGSAKNRAKEMGLDIYLLSRGK